MFYLRNQEIITSHQKCMQEKVQKRATRACPSLAHLSNDNRLVALDLYTIIIVAIDGDKWNAYEA